MNGFTVTITRGKSERTYFGTYNFCDSIMEDHCHRMHLVVLRKKYGVPLPSTMFIIGSYEEPIVRYGAVVRKNGERMMSISH